MPHTTATKVTVQISYTDTIERVQDLLYYIHFMESAQEKNHGRGQPKRKNETATLSIPVPKDRDIPF